MSILFDGDKFLTEVEWQVGVRDSACGVLTVKRINYLTVFHSVKNSLIRPNIMAVIPILFLEINLYSFNKSSLVILTELILIKQSSSNDDKIKVLIYPNINTTHNIMILYKMF